ncbi:SDR family oxidoreductase, partial [Photorhabdus temperata]|uniref:SDR family oxidoreductase n=1 Tax=Photorhabdus temperata TaxID=574560 RepID=UPI0034DD20B6
MKPTHNKVTIVMTKKNALLTGATGFIGAYMLDELMKTKSYAKIFVVIRKVD